MAGAAFICFLITALAAWGFYLVVDRFSIFAGKYAYSLLFGFSEKGEIPYSQVFEIRNDRGI